MPKPTTMSVIFGLSCGVGYIASVVSVKSAVIVGGNKCRLMISTFSFAMDAVVLSGLFRFGVWGCGFGYPS